MDNILSKASGRLYILRVCKFYGLPLDYLHLLVTSLILPIFAYAVQVWGCAYYHKYLSRIDRLFKRAFKLDYCKELFLIENIIAMKDKKLWNKITDSNSTKALDDLLLPERTMVTLRKRRHNYILPPPVRILPACRRLLFPLLHAEKERLRNAVANRVPASCWVPKILGTRCDRLTHSAHCLT